MKIRPALFLVLMFLTIASPLVQSAEIEGIEFPDVHCAGTNRLLFNNAGLIRYKVFFKAMIAGLYLGEGVDPKQALKDVPKRIEIYYYWSVKGSDLADGADKFLSESLSSDQMKKIRPQIDQLHKLYEDVKSGDRYSLTYIPEIGTELALNGEKKGIVHGKEFAEAYFSIWLGNKPMNVALRDQLTTPR